MSHEMTAQKPAIPALAMNEKELLGVLRNSLYPGAADDSIKLVISYCKASQLDPMQKPVHIVQIWDGNAKQMHDVVMPGIGLYRTQAARSGQYAGVTEPEFGEDVTESLDNVSVTYPKWCRVTVRRLMPNGNIVEFTANERWKENYATRKRDTLAPNAMWQRRPYAQLAKCAEAQALRKAFPEFGAQPTADEMEGKEIDLSAELAKSTPSVFNGDQSDPERDVLIRAAEAIANTGDVNALRDHLKAIGRDDRQKLGTAEMERLGAVAEAIASKADIIDVEFEEQS